MNFIVLGDFFDSNLNNFQLIPNHFLKKAELDHLKIIEDFYKTFLKLSIFRFDHEWKIEKNELDQNVMKFLNIEEWEYWIIEHPDEEIDNDLYLSLLLNDDICWAIQISGDLNNRKNYFFQQRILNYEKRKRISNLNLKNVINIQKYFDQIKLIKSDLLKDEFNFINKALLDYQNTFDFPDGELKTLSLFTIIDLLLTHNSKGNENSLRNQFVNKIILLNNQSDNTIDIKEYFNKENDTSCYVSSILNKLYDYRNCLAHGETHDFKKDLQIIQSPEKSFSFLNLIVKHLIIYSIYNKEILRDLKNC